MVLKRCMLDHKPRIHSLMASFEDLGVTKEVVDTTLEDYRAELLEMILGKAKK